MLCFVTARSSIQERNGAIPVSGPTIIISLSDSGKMRENVPSIVISITLEKSDLFLESLLLLIECLTFLNFEALGLLS
jgi:hypothetical protein